MALGDIDKCLMSSGQMLSRRLAEREDANRLKLEELRRLKESQLARLVSHLVLACSGSKDHYHLRSVSAPDSAPTALYMWILSAETGSLSTRRPPPAGLPRRAEVSIILFQLLTQATFKLSSS